MSLSSSDSVYQGRLAISNNMNKTVEAGYDKGNFVVCKSLPYFEMVREELSNY